MNADSTTAGTMKFTKMFTTGLREHANAWLRSVPWLVVAILGYLVMFSDVKNMDMNLAYQCYKACWAVILTIVCDNGLNWAVPDSEKERMSLDAGGIGPQVRRAIIFLGLCHLLQIA